MEATHQQLMLKILIGSAWIDQHLEPEEIDYLKRLLSRFHLDHETELQDLLKIPVPAEQTERWLVAYLKDSPDSERLKLLAAIGNLLISDHVVSSIEHDLLDEFHELMAIIPAPSEPVPPIHEIAPTLASKVGQFLRRVMSAATHLGHGH
ncbi:MAG TPA: hypothetical protein V6D19_21935 [Stenomitos sp.]